VTLIGITAVFIYPSTQRFGGYAWSLMR